MIVSPVRHYKTALFALALLVLIAASQALAPAARAWLGFSVWYGNRTATSVTVYWTVRGQEDAPSTGADVGGICWRPGSDSYVCGSSQVSVPQYEPVGTVRSYTISGLTCANAYRVSVKQSYILSQSWDWEEVTIQVPAC